MIIETLIYLKLFLTRNSSSHWQPPPTTKPPTTKPPPPTTPPPPVRYFEIFGMKKSTKKEEERSLKLKKLPKFVKVGKVDQRSELQTMSITKQLGCREKMKTTLCEKKKQTFVILRGSYAM